MTTIAELTASAKTLEPEAPWRWLEAGWRDMTAAPLLSFSYGLGVIGGGVAIVYGLWRTGYESLIPVAFGVFALVGPLLALGLYEMSRRLDAGQPPRLFPVRMAGPRSISQIAYISFFLMFAALVWLRVAIMLYALFASSTYTPMGDFIGFALTTGPGLMMLAVGTVVGGIIAFVIYLMTVVSIPMLMNERADPFTAIAAGVVAFKTNPGPMLLWAWLIAIITAAGVATAFVGLAVAFPLLGHATWHAYKDIRGVTHVDADGETRWPEDPRA